MMIGLHYYTCMISEKELVQTCKKDRRKGVSMMHTAFADRLYAVAMRYLDNREDAEEMVMDTFLSVHKNIDQFTWVFEGSLKVWLVKICINNCLMKLRKRNLAQTKDDIETLDWKVPSPDSQIQYHEIIQLIQTLKHPFSTVFLLYEIDGYRHPEIASSIGITESASKVYLHRAKRILRSVLEVNGYKNG